MGSVMTGQVHRGILTFRQRVFDGFQQVDGVQLGRHGIQDGSKERVEAEEGRKGCLVHPPVWQALVLQGS